MVLGILPRGDVNMDCNEAIAETNELLSSLENGFTVRYVSLEGKFFDKGAKRIREELYHADRINLSSQGYEVLADAIQPVLKECLEAK